jgi:hypothetical protein
MADNAPQSGIGEWFHCVSCGLRAAYFRDGVPDKLPPGAVCHEKPVCGLYNLLDARGYAAMHADVERITPASDMIELSFLTRQKCSNS